MNFVTRNSRLAAITIGVMLALGTAPALAGSCFEDVGCPGDHYIPKWQLQKMSCDSLWTLRNSIFHDNGYCFKTKKARQVWSNEGCSYWNSSDVPLNIYESANVSRIKGVEQQMGCL